MTQETQVFTPVEVTKIGELEHLLEREQEVREDRTYTGGLDHAHRFPNPDFRPHLPEEQPLYEVVFDKALLRGMLRMKRTLYEDIVYDTRMNHKDSRVVRRINPDKKAIVDGLIEAYNGNKK